MTTALFTILQSIIALSVYENHPIAKNGRLLVETADNLILKDKARNKELPCKIYYSKTGGPYPEILFSHGFGGNKDSFAVIGQHWASHGYIVIHPTHADGLKRGQGLPKGGLLGKLNNPEAASDRVADLVLILDALDELPKKVPGLKGKIDATQIGVGGHSLGAYTAMLIGGVTIDQGTDTQRSFLDRRVTCILPISAQGTGQQGLTKQSWNALKLPMMTITGTRDRGAGGQGLDWKKEPYQYSPAGNKYLIVIEGANHFSFGGRAGIQNQPITDAVLVSATLFWNGYLKDDKRAMTSLTPANLKLKIKVHCDIEAK